MSKFNIFTIDLCVIWWIIVATGVYTLLLKFLQKKSPHDVQTKGGGVKGLLNNVKKTALFLKDGFPNMQNTILADKCSSGWFAAPLVKNIGVFLICPKDIVLLNFPQVGTSPSSGGIIGGGLLLLKVIISVGLFQML